MSEQGKGLSRRQQRTCAAQLALYADSIEVVESRRVDRRDGDVVISDELHRHVERGLTKPEMVVTDVETGEQTRYAVTLRVEDDGSPSVDLTPVVDEP